MSACKTGGWTQYDGNWFYFKAPYQLAKGEFLDIDGRTFYFDYNSHMVKGSIWVDGKNYFTDINGAIIKNQWFMQRDDWYYAKEDGSLYTDGIYEINGKKYYFYGNGRMGTGLISHYSGGSNTLYIADDSGVLYSAGWVEMGSDWYYIKSDGTGARSQWISDYYYVDHNGAMVTGSQLIDGVYYYFDNSGCLVYSASSGTAGWQFNNGYWYYFNEDGTPADGWVDSYYFEHGKMLTNALITDWESNTTYYVGPEGYYITNGWYYAKCSDMAFYSTDIYYNYNWIYVDANGVVSQDTWEYIDGNWYYFDGSNMVTYGPMEINGINYWFDKNGVCLNPDGTGSFGGWTYMDGNWYYFDEDGTLLSGTEAVINGETYRFDYSGVMYADQVDYDYGAKKLYYYNSNGLIAGSLHDLVGLDITLCVHIRLYEFNHRVEQWFLL